MRIRLSLAGPLPNRAVWYATSGEALQPVRLVLESGGAAIDLTGRTVFVRLVRHSTGVVVRDWTAITVDDALKGWVSFRFLASDSPAAETLRILIRIDSAGSILPAASAPQLLATFGAIPGGISGAVVPLLDYVTGVDYCYSVRLRRSTYTGPCVRLRRASDNVEQDVGFASGVLDVAAAQTFAAGGNAYVTAWYDQTTNARHATQTQAIDQPQLVASGVCLTMSNGTPALRFFSAKLVTPTITTLPAVDVFAAGKLHTVQSGASAYFCDGVTADKRIILGGISAQFRMWCGSYLFGSGSHLSPVVMLGRSGGAATDVMYIDGTAYAGDAGTHLFSGLTIGAHRTITSTTSDTSITDILAAAPLSTVFANEVGRQFAMSAGSTWTLIT